MHPVINNEKDLPWDLFYNDEFVGTVETLTASLEVRAHIKLKKAKGYSFRRKDGDDVFCIDIREDGAINYQLAEKLKMFPSQDRESEALDKLITWSRN